MAGKGRAPCCDKNNVKKGPWSPAEDLRLTAFIQKNGHGNWRSLPKQAGLARCGKSCRLRWINYLSPNVKRGNFTLEEEEAIIKLHNSYGNKWSKIAAQLPGRTDNEIKNVWNTHLKKRLIKKDSEFHKDDKLSKGTSIISPSSPSSSSTSNLSCGDLNVEKGLNDQDYVTKMPDPLTEISTKSCQNNRPKETSRSSSFSSNVSNASILSSSSQVDVARPSDEMDSIFNSDQGLGEVNNAANEINIELFLDSEFDIWNVLENLESFEAPEERLVDFMPSSNLRVKHEKENEQSEWLRYLENYELGLERIIKEDQNKAAENDFEEMSACFPLWPPSPHNFDI